MSHVTQHLEAEALRMGFVKRRVPPDYRHIVWTAKCSKCPAEFSATWNPGMKPEGMKKFARQKQWDIDLGMRPLCPDCSHKKDVGPAAKPSHQSFAPFVPPATAIFDGLMAAAERRSKDQARQNAKATLIEVEGDLAKPQVDLADAKAAKAEARATMEGDARLAQMRGRAAHARAMRSKRIEERKAAEAAGTKALHQYLLKERAVLHEAAPSSAMVRENMNSQITPNVAPQETKMSAPTPTPKITHAVFQCLDAIFDPAKRLYRSGYTDQRVAKECGTSEDVVAYLRNETFGQLAEDPRISSMRDDIELLRMESAETFGKLQRQMGEIASRVEQLARGR